MPDEVEKFLQRNQSKRSKRLLLHIDEHRSMSDSPDFRLGAMQLAGSLPGRCRVIATYLEPPDLPAQGSSKVCSFPIAMVLVDVSLLLTFDASDTAPGLPKIRLHAEPKGGKERRLLATLRVKLSLLLGQQLDQLHVKQDDRSELRNTSRCIQEELDKEGKLENKLTGAIKSFGLSLPTQGKLVSGSVDLLLGMDDSEADGLRYPGVVSLDNRKLNLPIETLMAVRDTKDDAFDVHQAAQNLFRQSAMAARPDWCDGQLLERVGLGDALNEYEFQCQRLEDGIKQNAGKSAKIFTNKGTPCIDGIRNMEHDVMHHALSEGGKAGTHKGVDIWFKTKQDELVLADVTGATSTRTCQSKAQQMANNCDEVKTALQKATVHMKSVIGILLAPSCASAIGEPTSVQVVQGDAARDLLGGLQQLLTWLGEDVD